MLPLFCIISTCEAAGLIVMVDVNFTRSNSTASLDSLLHSTAFNEGFKGTDPQKYLSESRSTLPNPCVFNITRGDLDRPSKTLGGPWKIDSKKLSLSPIIAAITVKMMDGVWNMFGPRRFVSHYGVYFSLNPE